MPMYLQRMSNGYYCGINMFVKKKRVCWFRPLCFDNVDLVENAERNIPTLPEDILKERISVTYNSLKLKKSLYGNHTLILHAKHILPKF